MLNPTDNPQILGIILVANSNLRGDRLIFRYPQVQRNSGLSLETRYAIRGKMFGDTYTPGQDVMWKEPPADRNEPPIINLYATRYSAYNMPSVVLCPLLCPKSLVDGSTFELILDKTMFIGQPVMPKRTRTFLEARQETSDNKNDVLTMYNFFLVIERDSPPSFIRMIKHIAQQIATASLYEENRCGYITQQISQMLAIREEWLIKNQCEGPNKPDHNFLTYEVLQASSLAKTMSDILHGLKDERKINCTFNKWVSLSASLKDIQQLSSVPLRPYQTILLLEKEDEFLASLPEDASPSLRMVVKAAKPTKNFHTLREDTGIPLSQLFRIAAHLIYWGKAKVIVLLTKLNIYTLNPNPPAHHQPDRYYLHLDEADFNKEFQPYFNLPETLKSFSVPAKLGDLIHRLPHTHQRNFVSVVVWLLRHDLLIQQHTYIFLMVKHDIPKKTPRKAAGKNAEKRYKTESLRSSLSIPVSSITTVSSSSISIPTLLTSSAPASQPAPASTPSCSPMHTPESSHIPSSPQTPTHIPVSPHTPTHLEQVPLGAAGGGGVGSGSGGASAGGVYPLSPIPLSEEEAEFINKLNDNSPIFKIFKQVCPYFRGQHHVEEIMWRSNVSRDDLFKVFEKYDRLLVIVNL